MPEPLRLVDEHGEIIRSSCPDCNEHIRTNASLEKDLELAEREMRNLRRTVAAYKKDRQHERDRYKQRARVEALFQRYQEIVQKPASKLGAARFDAIRKMIDLGYTDEQFELAFYGAAHSPFIANGKKFQDAELICRDESKFEDFANRGAIAVKGMMA